ncbi:hypothetical protein BKA61DRAFT_130124 [Leptodontidium sp. MPI-SDFR-AT-0119]|nr:hypothetical protein BKA61DRAFT_130124 [Leptodontidium sp. MPI-SDFR-AT-0119]
MYMRSRRYCSHAELGGAHIPKWDKLSTRKVGLRRQHGSVMSWAAGAKSPTTRKSLNKWEENCCSHLAGSFNDLINIRAKIARLVGSRSYLELDSRKKMLDANSAKSFVAGIKDEMAPYIHTHNENMLEMKLKDESRNISFQSLRNDPRYSTSTLRDFQDSHPEYRLHLGEIYYYASKENWKETSGAEYASLHYYFPTQSTSRKLLGILGPVFGVDFVELSPEQPDCEKIVNAYFNSPSAPPEPRVGRRNTPLVFIAQNSTDISNPGAYLGSMVLNLIHQDSKPQSTHCSSFPICEEDSS